MSDAAVQTVLVLVVRDGDAGPEVLLGTKRRGFGQGRVVAPGGKIDPGETALEAARRELAEETGLSAEALHPAGEVFFDFTLTPATRNMTAHVFVTRDVMGVAGDSDEIAALWCATNDLPLGRMWPDARHWLPLALAGSLTRATFTYAADGTTLAAVAL